MLCFFRPLMGRFSVRGSPGAPFSLLDPSLPYILLPVIPPIGLCRIIVSWAEPFGGLTLPGKIPILGRKAYRRNNGKRVEIVKRRIGTIFIIFGLICLLGAGGLYAYSVALERRAQQGSAEALQELLAQMEAQRQAAEAAVTPTPEPAPPVTPQPTAKPWPTRPPQEPPELTATPETPEPTETPEPPVLEYVGYLTIPDLNLVLPVCSTCTALQLMYAPCRYTGSVEGNDLVISAHNYKSHFGRLKDLSIGAKIIFTDLDWTETRYVVVESEVLQPEEVRKMVISGYDLTLFTCTKGGLTRYTVRCMREEPAP